jgi:exodeoxyribonuclease VII large subunit
MSELFDQPPEGQNAPEFSVSEISGVVKRMIEGEFSHVRIRGEVGRVSMPRSGHVYMDLKDDRSVLAGVIWKGVASRLSTRPEEGMEVVATGRLTTFPGQSKYQMVIEDIKPAGMGALMAMLEKRKAMLAAEGLFDPARKQQLPYLPEVIGVVTSPSGAVIRDILHRLRDRFPRKVLIWPVAVQGQNCAPEVANAIRGFNALTPGGALPRPDLLIVARGGGSIEDLWGFNEEEVARAAAASEIPLISAVGHETDTTLIDYVSDMRAPTPTAAAELAVPVRLELMGWLDQQNARLSRALTQGITQRGQRLRDLGRGLPRAEALLDGPRQKLDVWGERLPQGLTRLVQMRRVNLSEAAGGLRASALRRQIEEENRRLAKLSPRLGAGLSRAIEAKSQALEHRASRLKTAPILADIKRKSQDLNGLSQRFEQAAKRQADAWRKEVDRLDHLRETLGYKATLQRGYAVVRGDGAVVTTLGAAKKAKALEVEFADGKLQLDAGTVGGKPAAKPARKASPKPPEQGSLF